MKRSYFKISTSKWKRRDEITHRLVQGTKTCTFLCLITKGQEDSAELLSQRPQFIIHWNASSILHQTTNCAECRGINYDAAGLIGLGVSIPGSSLAGVTSLCSLKPVYSGSRVILMSQSLQQMVEELSHPPGLKRGETPQNIKSVLQTICCYLLPMLRICICDHW